MNFDTLYAIIQKTKKVKINHLRKVVQNLYFLCEEDTDSIENYYNLYDLFDLAFEQVLWEGDEDDYHNLAVTCAREDDFENACRVLDKGLEIFEYSNDLLSDYLVYGVNCGRQEKSAECYYRLLNKRPEWNWRAYQFSIMYMFSRMSTSRDVNTKSILTMIHEYQEKFPMEEESYMLEARFYQMHVSLDKEGRTFQSVLEYATSEECPVQRTPKCDLNLADKYFEIGKDLHKAAILLDRCKRNSIETQLSVNRNYVYLLSALCKMTEYYDNYPQDKRVDENDEQKNKEVNEVYNDYHIAALALSDNRIHDCKTLIEAFVRETGVPYPYIEDGIEN